VATQGVALGCQVERAVGAPVGRCLPAPKVRPTSQPGATPGVKTRLYF